MEAAEELQVPVIIGTAEICCRWRPWKSWRICCFPMADRASVPVVVHLDHGLKEETCRRALELGFSSIMYDCSTDPYEVNVQKIAEMTKLAHSYHATIEAELGHVADNEGAGAVNDPTMYYTQPDQAKDFVEKTGVDALAIAVGTAHGAYKLPPKLDFDRIREIAAAIDPFLVLHGGSGLTDEDFHRAIQEGISKVNIFTDINHAGAKAAYETYAAGKELVTDQQPAMVEAIKQATMEKMRLFNA